MLTAIDGVAFLFVCACMSTSVRAVERDIHCMWPAVKAAQNYAPGYSRIEVQDSCTTT